MPTIPIRKDSLFFREGGSDKVYQLQLEEAGDGLYHVAGFNGRRGQALTRQLKTADKDKNPVPVSLEEANRVYDKTLAEKVRKGYTPDEGGVTYAGTDLEQRKTDLVPQLLNPIQEHEIDRYLDDDAWLMQEKKDGVRIMLRTQDKGVDASNRKGLLVAFPEGIAAWFCDDPIGSVYDGELIGETYWVFDFLQEGDEDFRDDPYAERFKQLQRFPYGDDRRVQLVPTAFTREEKRALYHLILEQEGEGVVFKRKDSKYHPGRPQSGGSQVKFKFYSDATCQVLSVHATKRSVKVGVLTDDGQLISVGNVTIPPNHSVPAEGWLVDVKYLYRYPAGSLFQPQYKGVRKDKELPDLESSLKLKPTDTDEDA